MKRIFFIISITLFFGCQKREVTIPDFNVKTLSLTYQVNDTVVFDISGNADFITFYSGEIGNNYDYKDRTSITGKPQIQFTSYKQYGTQLNSLQLKVTNELPAYTIEGIAAAEWSDITSRANLSTGTNNTSSGVIDISDQMKPDLPVYIAFRKVDVETLVPNTWTINNFKLETELSDGTILPVKTIADAGWVAIDVLNPLYKWSITSTSLKCTGGRTNPVNEDWVISSPIYPFNIAPDRGVPLKSTSDNPLDTYEYIYDTPGVYRVVFVAANNTLYGTKEKIHEFTITIQP